MGRPLVILDRDGTLIDIVRHAETGVITVAFHPSHLRLLPGVIEGLQALTRAGFALGLATNQPGPAKGQFPVAAVHATNAALVELLAADGITIEFVEACLHHPEGGPGGDASLVRTCDCRKPGPGMLRSALERTGTPAQQAWMIGDSPGDVAAARAAGVRAGLLFPADRCELCPLRGGPPIEPDLMAGSFDELVRAILKQHGSG